jgi:hypothetical protein
MPLAGTNKIDQHQLRKWVSEESLENPLTQEKQTAKPI